MAQLPTLLEWNSPEHKHSPKKRQNWHDHRSKASLTTLSVRMKPKPGLTRLSTEPPRLCR